MLIFCSFVTWGFFLMCSSSKELFQRSSQNPPFFLHYCFVLQPSFSSLRICRAVIFLPKPIILFRKPQKLQLAAHHFVNILTVCSRDHFCVQFQSSFSYCNFSDNNLPCLHPSETLKPPGERCGLLIIYLFDRPEQPTRGIFKRQLEHRGGWCYLSFLPQLPNLPACSLVKMLIQSRAGSGPPAAPGGSS